MKRVCQLVLLFILTMLASSANKVFADASVPAIDTISIMHLIDGNATEWPDSLFTQDKETGLMMAVDNDKENLFVIIKQANQQMQVKMMRNGMSLYIDVKGKHKENTGIEFPLKSESTGFGGTQRDRWKYDLQAARQMFALNMFALKIVGMNNSNGEKQGLSVENSVNIAFDWDDKQSLIIEYIIPIKLFSSEAALKGKPVSLGFIINGMDAPSSVNANGMTTVSQLIAVPSNGTAGGSGRGAGGRSALATNTSNANQLKTDQFSKEQSYWNKYDFRF